LHSAKIFMKTGRGVNNSESLGSRQATGQGASGWVPFRILDLESLEGLKKGTYGGADHRGVNKLGFRVLRQQKTENLACWVRARARSDTIKKGGEKM